MDQRTCYILLILLKQNDYITLSQILEILESKYNTTCDKKTVAASIRSINQFFETVYGLENAIVSRKKKGSKFENTILVNEQLTFLYDALTSNNSISSDDGNELFDILTKIIPDDFKENITKKNTHRGNAGLNALFTINRAIDEQKSLHFEYVSYVAENGQIIEKHKEYLVSPYETHMQDGRYYLISYYEKHPGQMTVFRIDRMSNVRSGRRGEFIEKRDELDAQQPKKSVNMFAGNDHIDCLELECENQILRAVVDQFGKNIKIMQTNEPNISNVEIYDTYLTEGLIGWIMLLSPKIKVIGPEKVVIKIKKTLQDTMNQYF